MRKCYRNQVEWRASTVKFFVILGLVSVLLVTFAINQNEPTQAQEGNIKPPSTAGQKEEPATPMMI